MRVVKVFYTERLQKSYAEAPRDVRKAFDKQVRLLVGNVRHPSLHAKKYDEAVGIWQAWVNRAWRFYFTIDGDAYTIIELAIHPTYVLRSSRN